MSFVSGIKSILLRRSWRYSRHFQVSVKSKSEMYASMFRSRQRILTGQLIQPSMLLLSSGGTFLMSLILFLAFPLSPRKQNPSQATRLIISRRWRSLLVIGPPPSCGVNSITLRRVLTSNCSQFPDTQPEPSPSSDAVGDYSNYQVTVSQDGHPLLPELDFGHVPATTFIRLLDEYFIMKWGKL